jgi:hypothetical protein
MSGVVRVLVTVGSGFIGSFIIEEVLKKGWEATVVDNLSTGSITNDPGGLPFYQIDINSQSIEEIFITHKPDIVIHQAAQVSVEYSKHHPLIDSEINILGTFNFLQLCTKYKVSKFIYASSAAVYGFAKNVPILETDALNPISFYGLSKQTACIKDMMEAIKRDEVDVVIGSRFLNNSNMKISFSKMAAVKFFRSIIYRITKKRITDPTSGFKAFKANVYKRFTNSRNFYYDLPDSNFIIDILLQKLTILEIPVNMFDREHGESKIHHSGLKPFIYMAQTLLSILIVIMKNKMHLTGGKTS